MFPLQRHAIKMPRHAIYFTRYFYSYFACQNTNVLFIRVRLLIWYVVHSDVPRGCGGVWSAHQPPPHVFLPEQTAVRSDRYATKTTHSLKHLLYWLYGNLLTRITSVSRWNFFHWLINGRTVRGLLDTLHAERGLDPCSSCWTHLNILYITCPYV